jgi:hypothetical protein
VRPDGLTISVRVGMPKSDGFRPWSEERVGCRCLLAIYPVEQGPVRPGAAAQPRVALLADVVRVEGAMSGVDRLARGQRFGSKMYRAKFVLSNCAKNTTRR